MGGPSKRSAWTATAPAWIPVALVAASALVPILRLPVLLTVAAVAGAALLRRPTLPPAGASVAWIAVLPIAVALAVGLLPDPAVANPGACDDLLAAPVVRRVAQAACVLGTVAVLARRMGGRRSLGIVMPPDRRVTLLALATPVLVPIFLVAGPLMAGPFFAEVVLGLRRRRRSSRRPFWPWPTRRWRRLPTAAPSSAGEPAAAPGRSDHRPGVDVRLRPPGVRRPGRRIAAVGRDRGGRPRRRRRRRPDAVSSSCRSPPTPPSTSPWPWHSPAGSPDRLAGRTSRHRGSLLPYRAAVAPATITHDGPASRHGAPRRRPKSRQGSAP